MNLSCTFFYKNRKHVIGQEFFEFDQMEGIQKIL